MIIIVGAGITGLSAAFELVTRGIPFQILEASPRAGGLIRTDRMDGFVIEAGPESVLAQKPAALDLCEALGLTPRLISTNHPRTAFVLKRGKLHPLPSPSVLGVPTTLGGIAQYGLLSPVARARLALEIAVPRRRGDDDESIGSFFRRRFGNETVGLVAEPLLGGIHAGDIETLSMKSLFPRLVEAEARSGSVLRAFRGAPRASAAGDGLFRTLAGGMGELIEALERKLPAGSIRYESPVAAIAKDAATGERGWQVRTTRGNLAADGVILAAPAYVVAGILSGVDAEVARRCAEVPYASTGSVALAWPREAVHHPLRGSGFVVARRYNDVRITACTWVSSKWTGRAPAGSVLLRAFIGSAQDPSAVDLSDEEMVDTVVRDLAPLLGIAGRPSLATVARWRRAGAQHTVGQIARVAAIDARLAAHGGLFVAGSGFRSVGIPDCIADGRAAAARASEWTKIRS
ncbi:MAG: protoporphyrinogen/coproporphyrinogen oxidase [Acidobacteriota bacterium]|jgi:oxygen-dependent protoporphyrinogen oxidase